MGSELLGQPQATVPALDLIMLLPIVTLGMSSTSTSNNSMSTSTRNRTSTDSTNITTNNISSDEVYSSSKSMTRCLLLSDRILLTQHTAATGALLMSHWHLHLLRRSPCSWRLRMCESWIPWL